ncbi:RHS repeat-associated core domain-containing protein [Chryseobacterium phosphatilyticum]|uniref:RHS repeat-associated core domain-containing protein n=1 Tax=Chryseobacterium phosphatilyticum TaxID=475075 RepID=UPI001E2E4170|nr:RHS repeat-associated core domain-containing protein [Chryseobacterium phosphatilyticum]
MTGTNNYYPFGLNHIGGGNMSSFSNYHSYKFGGKELQETGMYDFGARMYMPDLGRWGVIDPMAETMRRYSPYNYAFNNPISFIDPDGMAPMHQFAMISDARPDTTSGWTNPGWLGRGTSDGINYGATLGSGGGGSVYESEYGTVYTGSEARDAFSDLVSGNPPRSKNNGSFWNKIGRFFINLFGRRGGKANVSVGAVERVPPDYSADGTRLFGLITNANYNPMAEYRANRDNPFYNEGESSLDRSFRLMNSSHIEIMQDFGGGGYNMFGGYGRIGNATVATEEISIISKISAEAEANGILSTQKRINPAKVAEYFEQMSNGTYKPTGGAGYIYEGKYILTDGNHRMNAAIQHGIESGNFKYIEELINKGNFIRRNPLIDNYKVYKLPVK